MSSTAISEIVASAHVTEESYSQVYRPLSVPSESTEVHFCGSQFPAQLGSLLKIRCLSKILI